MFYTIYSVYNTYTVYRVCIPYVFTHFRVFYRLQHDKIVYHFAFFASCIVNEYMNMCTHIYMDTPIIFLHDKIVCYFASCIVDEYVNMCTHIYMDTPIIFLHEKIVCYFASCVVYESLKI